MERFHVKIGFKVEHIPKLKDMTYLLNSKTWKYSEHCLDSIKYWNIDIEGILNSILKADLKFEDIFEYYTENDYITKICYRIDYSIKYDIIIVLTMDKKIVTIYLNKVGDNHDTLREELYNKGENK